MITSIRFSTIVILMATFMVITLSCSLTAPPVPSGNEQAAPTVAISVATTESPPLSTSSPAASEVTNVVINELDPCKLVTKESAETALGLPVDEPFIADEATFRLCMYSAVPGEKMVSVTVFEGENAKNYFLNSSTQLLNGCQMSFTATTRQQTPTPFPPEVEALKVESILDLYLRDLEAWKGCGGSYAQLADLGDNAYTSQGFIVGAVIGVATEDVYASFLVGDTGMTPEQALEAAKGLVRRATSP